jgi:hypothetical protein
VHRRGRSRASTTNDLIIEGSFNLGMLASTSFSQAAAAAALLRFVVSQCLSASLALFYYLGSGPERGLPSPDQWSCRSHMRFPTVAKPAPEESGRLWLEPDVVAQAGLPRLCRWLVAVRRRVWAWLLLHRRG